jgi:monothiol glutaredoxin
MSIQPALRERIQSLLDAHRVVLFMKGQPNAPQCGFSAKAVGLLSGLGVPWHGVDVLADAEIRDGIKVFGSWPTIPQLYIGGELVGGSDIIEQLVNSGELHQLLDLPAPDRSVPTIAMTETAAVAIGRAMADVPNGTGLHLSVDPGFNAQFALKEITGNELVAHVQGLDLYIDVISAPRANGMEIDWVEDVRGAGLAIRNPNAPPPVQPLSIAALRDRLANGDLTVIDVRPAADRAQAPFPEAHRVLDENSLATLAALPNDTALAFLCHVGNSSRQAAEHFRGLGFRDVYNIEGGIDAWAQQIDPSVPRY